VNYDGLTKYDSKVAQTYDSDREGEAHWRLEHEWLSAYARRRSLGRVLDVPTGTGRLLTAMHSATAIVGVDVSDAMLEMARAAARAVPHCEVVLARGDAMALEFPDRSFDTVVCFRLVHLIPPTLLRQLFAELRRVCAGVVVAQVYVGNQALPAPGPVRRLAGQIKRAILRKGRPWAHIQSYSHGEGVIADAYRVAGLRLIGCERLDMYEGASVEMLELAP